MAVRQRPRGSKILVLGNFNANLAGPEGSEQVDEIVAALAVELIEDMPEQFLLANSSGLRTVGRGLCSS